MNAKDIKAVTLHPGGVRTEIWEKFTKGSCCLNVLLWVMMPFAYYFFKSPESGAQTTLECTFLADDKLEAGAYYDNCKRVASNPLANQENNKKMWDITTDLLKKAGLKLQEI